MASDDPSAGMWAALKQVLPNLCTLCLDPTHLPMVFEYASWLRTHGAQGSGVLIAYVNAHPAKRSCRWARHSHCLSYRMSHGASSLIALVYTHREAWQRLQVSYRE